jgi:hypothetical protein
MGRRLNRMGAGANTNFADDYTSHEYRYLMYLVLNEYLEDFEPIVPLIKLLRNFGRILQDKAMITLPMKGAYGKTRQAVLKLPWNYKTWEELDRTHNPYLLITCTPLANLDPVKDKFIIMHFSEATSNVAQYADVLDEIAKEIKCDKDIFKWKQMKARQQIRGRTLKRVLESVEAKPGAFGFSVDLKKLLIGM